MIASAGVGDWVKWFSEHWFQGGLIGLALGLTVYYLIRNYAAIRRFVDEVTVELAKCSWPWDPLQKGMKRYKEITDSTVVVIVSMLLFGAYTSSFDFVLVKVIGRILKMNVL